MCWCCLRFRFPFSTLCSRTRRAAISWPARRRAFRPLPEGLLLAAPFTGEELAVMRSNRAFMSSVEGNIEEARVQSPCAEKQRWLCCVLHRYD